MECFHTLSLECLILWKDCWRRTGTVSVLSGSLFANVKTTGFRDLKSKICCLLREEMKLVGCCWFKVKSFDSTTRSSVCSWIVSGVTETMMPVFFLKKLIKIIPVLLEIFLSPVTHFKCTFNLGLPIMEWGKCRDYKTVNNDNILKYTII